MKIKKETAIKILTVALTVLMLVTCMQSTVLANSLLDPNSIQAQSSDASDQFDNAAELILGIVQVIAIATAIIFLIVLAIKYIGSAPEDKAEIKKHAVVYVVGAVLLFGASGILQLIKMFAESAFGSGGAKQ